MHGTGHSLSCCLPHSSNISQVLSDILVRSSVIPQFLCIFINVVSTILAPHESCSHYFIIFPIGQPILLFYAYIILFTFLFQYISMLYATGRYVPVVLR